MAKIPKSLKSQDQIRSLGKILDKIPNSKNPNSSVVVHLLSCVRLLVTPWTAAGQAFLSFTICQSLLKFMFI